MEAVTNIADRISPREFQPDKLSQTDHIETGIPVKQQQAIGDVFDRWRLNCGWNPWDDVTQMAAIASFVHTLDRENVPPECYGELYERVLSVRAQAIQNGKTIPNFGVELMVACWNGEYGLKAELRQREIAAGRTLAANAATVCQHCFGSNWRKVDPTNRLSPVKKCDHTDE